MWELLLEKGRPIVHFFIEPQKNIGEWKQFVELFPPHQYSYLPYDPLNPFVDKFHARDRKLPIVIYYNPQTHFQAFYDGPFEYQELGDWIGEVAWGQRIDPPPHSARVRIPRNLGKILGTSAVFAIVLGVVLGAMEAKRAAPSGRSE
jgi:hypothetical protein